MKSLTLLTAAALAVASPVAKRETGGILLCTGANATGTCNYATYPLETCIDLVAPFANNTNTFAPDGEPFACYPYLMPCGGLCTSPEGCTLGAVSFYYPHKFNLSDVGWANWIQSFECHPVTTM
ncbi:hypothetical protein SPI_06688 [Niveomyces insectorum RCEF 264]|uniref:Uncharacterized protein n=1 Tax=Niveomyces insectorum RCEF 264 TaxID=1081102 RepID=A0A167RHX9_9HYPO|nr:hypothetical protein SPI_06688 [Niveomyces insectorum RCEF 264]